MKVFNQKLSPSRKYLNTIILSSKYNYLICRLTSSKLLGLIDQDLKNIFQLNINIRKDVGDCFIVHSGDYSNCCFHLC